MGKPAIEMVSEATKIQLKKKKIQLGYNTVGKSAKVKYSRHTDTLKFFRGYDFLENIIVVRSYIQKKHGIDICLLELLLYLAPKQYFTHADYRVIPKQYKYCYMKNVIATGYVELVGKGEGIGKKIFMVNRKGQEIIRNYYELLAGEKFISEERFRNPLAKTRTRTPFDKKRMDLIATINQLPVSESKKGTFQ